MSDYVCPTEMLVLDQTSKRHGVWLIDGFIWIALISFHKLWNACLFARSTEAELREGGLCLE